METQTISPMKEKNVRENENARPVCVLSSKIDLLIEVLIK